MGKVEFYILGKKYKKDLNTKNIFDEIAHLKKIHDAEFGKDVLSPIELLNVITEHKLNMLFPNVCIAIRMFCTIPVTVASGERSFSVLKRIKSFNRSVMSQERLNGLGMLSIESKLARTINFEKIIENFAFKKARKVHF